MNMINLPSFVPKKIIAERLPLIFPEGTPNRNYCIRDLAAGAIFTMLYIGAVEGGDVYFSPKHLYRMTEEQSQKTSDEERMEYRKNVERPGFHMSGKRWYHDNTREPIRDETLKEGLVALDVVKVDEKIPTTSSKPRYFLARSFADLFDSKLSGQALAEKISIWQTNNLSKNALSRIRILKAGAAAPENKILVNLPNKETRYMDAGPSTQIAKAVIEEFALRFLKHPFLLWLSESGNKVVKRDDRLASELGIKIDASKHLPDIILVDIGGAKTFFIFIEVVATDGAITEARQKAFYELTDKAGYDRSQILFVSAYADRQSPGFKKTVSHLAWNSFAWFISEPDGLFILKDGVFKLTQ